MLQLYKNIKQRRTDLHLTQSELAKKWGTQIKA
jgi:predicted transcriptional regulator